MPNKLKPFRCNCTIHAYCKLDYIQYALAKLFWAEIVIHTIFISRIRKLKAISVLLNCISERRKRKEFDVCHIITFIPAEMCLEAMLGLLRAPAK